MRYRTRLVTALGHTPLGRPTHWLLHHVVPGARDRRRNQAIDIETVNFMASVLEVDSSAVDVGAHVGAVLAEIVRIAPKGEHHAVEPLPDLAADLRAAFPHVHVHECVLGSGDWVASTGGTATINRNVDDPGYSSVGRLDHPRVKGKKIETITVASSTLDEIVGSTPRIRFAKIDVEGFELQVLRGAHNLLTTHRPFIVFEHEPIADTADDTTALFTLLDEASYSVERLIDWQHPRRMTLAAFQNCYASGDSYFVARPREAS